MSSRQERLLAKLKARTSADGKPKKNYEASVAAIRAELATIEERIRAAAEIDTSEEA